tara:strand:+ start:536 stop:1447 length:912 start_codon:yes stop_codon:yes gene_type:complete
MLTHRFFLFTSRAYDAFATYYDASRGFPQGRTARGLPLFADLEKAGERGLVALKRETLTNADQTKIAASIRAGSADEAELTPVFPPFVSPVVIPLDSSGFADSSGALDSSGAFGDSSGAFIDSSGALIDSSGAFGDSSGAFGDSSGFIDSSGAVDSAGINYDGEPTWEWLPIPFVAEDHTARPAPVAVVRPGTDLDHSRADTGRRSYIIPVAEYDALSAALNAQEGLPSGIGTTAVTIRAIPEKYDVQLTLDETGYLISLAGNTDRAALAGKEELTELDFEAVYNVEDPKFTPRPPPPVGERP